MEDLSYFSGRSARTLNFIHKQPFNSRPMPILLKIATALPTSMAGCVFSFWVTHNVRDDLQPSHFVG